MFFQTLETVNHLFITLLKIIKVVEVLYVLAHHQLERIHRMWIIKTYLFNYDFKIDSSDSLQVFFNFLNFSSHCHKISLKYRTLPVSTNYSFLSLKEKNFHEWETCTLLWNQQQWTNAVPLFFICIQICPKIYWHTHV